MTKPDKASIKPEVLLPTKNNPLNVLIVEDEPTHAAILRHTIQSANPNIKLKIVSSLKEYRNSIAHSQPDIVLMDIYLSNGNAFEVLASPPEARLFPIVVITSSSDEKIVVKAMKAGALDCIVKSTSAFKAMPQIIERTLREWKHIQEHRQVKDARKNNRKKGQNRQ